MTKPSSPADDNGKLKARGPITLFYRLWELNRRYFIILMIAAAMIVVGTSQRDVSSLNFRSPKEATMAIPPCSGSPWKPNENLVGTCPGGLKPYPSASESTSISASECAESCCSNPECISWQHRRDVGCLQGKDIRLGMEKDGPAAWCSDHPPHRWNGQYLVPHGKTKEQGIDGDIIRKGACDLQTWDPNEEIGQCFGLGGVKNKDGASESAQKCMEACCADPKCGAWQWNKALGCFYGGGMHSCTFKKDNEGGGNEVVFEPFVGKRKVVVGRGYTDNHGKVWQQSQEYSK